MNVSEYARHLAVDESTVRQCIAEGRLKGAVEPDGSIIDVEKADGLFAENRLRQQSATLVDARARRLAATVANLEDSVDDLRHSLIDPAEAARIAAAEFEVVSRHLRRLPAEAAPAAAGRDAPAAALAIAGVVSRAMQDISATAVIPTPRQRRPAAQSRGEPPSFLELETTRTSLTATRMEMLRAQSRGEVVPARRLLAGIGEKLDELRSALNSLPSRVAPYFQHLDAAGALALLEREVGAMVADLGSPPTTVLAGDERPPPAPRGSRGPLRHSVNSKLRVVLNRTGWRRVAATNDETTFQRGQSGEVLTARQNAAWEWVTADGEVVEGKGATALAEALEEK